MSSFSNLSADAARPFAAVSKVGATAPEFVGDGPCHALREADMPLTESLQDTVKRILPLWHDSIAPAVMSGQKVLIVAHGNSIRVSSTSLDTQLMMVAAMLWRLSPPTSTIAYQA